MEMIIIGLEVFITGWVIGWMVFDYCFYKPQQKLLKSAMKGMKEALELNDILLVLAEIRKSEKTPEKLKDGSVLSPIQIKKSK